MNKTNRGEVWSLTNIYKIGSRLHRMLGSEHVISCHYGCQCICMLDTPHNTYHNSQFMQLNILVQDTPTLLIFYSYAAIFFVWFFLRHVSPFIPSTRLSSLALVSQDSLILFPDYLSTFLRCHLCPILYCPSFVCTRIQRSLYELPLSCVLSACHCFTSSLRNTSCCIAQLALSPTAVQICYTSLAANLRRNNTKFIYFCQIIHEINC